MTDESKKKSLNKMLGIQQMIDQYTRPYKKNKQSLIIKNSNKERIITKNYSFNNQNQKSKTENQKLQVKSMLMLVKINTNKPNYINYQNNKKQQNNKSSLILNRNQVKYEKTQNGTFDFKISLANSKGQKSCKDSISLNFKNNNNLRKNKDKSYLYLRLKNNSTMNQHKISNNQNFELQNPLLYKINQKLKDYENKTNPKKAQIVKKQTENQQIKTQVTLQINEEKQSQKNYIIFDTNYYGFSFQKKINIKKQNKQQNIIQSIQPQKRKLKNGYLKQKDDKLKDQKANSSIQINQIKSKQNYTTLSTQQKQLRYKSMNYLNKKKPTESLSSIKNVLLKDRYELIKPIGRGMSGQVFQAKDILSNRFIALKITNIDSVQYQFYKETQHQNIIKYYNNFIQGNKRYLVLQYFPMTLSSLIKDNYRLNKNKIKLTEQNIKHIFKNMVTGLSYLHSLSISHRDIKLDNIVISSDLQQIKFIDFGLCIDITKTQQGLCKQFCGTLSYLPPEIIEGKSYDPKKADIWSLGICLYALILNRFPYKGKNQIQLLSKISKNKLIYPENFNIHLKQLIQQMLQKNPIKRISIIDVKNSIWLS